MRHELKSIFWPSYKARVAQIVQSKFGASKEHEPRRVSSIYFDDQYLSCYHDSDEGLTPRKKYRLRWYGNADLTPSTEVCFEIKETFPYFRSKKINFRGAFRDFDIFEECRGLPMLQPVLVISYNRQYFKNEFTRFTIDTEIESEGLAPLAPKKYNFHHGVLEFKFDRKINIDFISKQFPLMIMRSSKYCDALEKYL